MLRTMLTARTQALREPAVRRRLLREAGILGFFALLTAVSARIVIPLPFTVVPITLQVWAVLLSGLVLGARGGAGSQLIYLGALLAGAPISASGVGGPAVLFTPTMGYILAFAPAAFAAGWLAQRLAAPHVSNEGAPTLRMTLAYLVAALAGVVVIYGGGVAWLTGLLGDVRLAVQQGLVPFIGVDLAKAAAAAAVARGGRLLFRPNEGAN